jgi:hypothetical protein|uniref:Alternative protein ATP1A1 n=1 Tax=Homo sapiens TaxID=9606 RepID=L0R4U4_HUMAN|nr:alternative protein ATP1A1 [Homo sapiens]
MKHVALWGEGGGLPENHPSVEMTAGKVFMCLFVFVKKEHPERLKEYILYLDFYK